MMAWKLCLHPRNLAPVPQAEGAGTDPQFHHDVVRTFRDQKVIPEAKAAINSWTLVRLVISLSTNGCYDRNCALLLRSPTH